MSGTDTSPTFELDTSDRAVVEHLRHDYAAADEATRARLRKINGSALTELHARRRRLLRELAANERAIAMRELVAADE